MKDQITINIKPVKSSIESLKTFFNNVKDKVKDNNKIEIQTVKDKVEQTKVYFKFQQARIKFALRFSKSGVVKDILDKIEKKEPLEEWQEYIINEFNKNLNK